MSQKAIIHKATRVIRRLTTLDPPEIAADEEAVVMAHDIDLAGGFWKLDARNRKVTATSQEINNADVDENRVTVKQQAKTDELFAAIDAVLTDTRVSAKVRRFFKAFKGLRGG